MRACVRAFVRACVSECVRACVRAHACACVRVGVTRRASVYGVRVHVRVCMFVSGFVIVIYGKQRKTPLATVIEGLKAPVLRPEARVEHVFSVKELHEVTKQY